MEHQISGDPTSILVISKEGPNEQITFGRKGESLNSLKLATARFQEELDTPDGWVRIEKATSGTAREAGEHGDEDADVARYVKQLRYLHNVKHLVVRSEPPAPIPTFLLQAAHHLSAPIPQPASEAESVLVGDTKPKRTKLQLLPNLETLTFGAGCFNDPTSRLLPYKTFYQALLISTSPRRLCFTLTDADTIPFKEEEMNRKGPNRRLPPSMQLNGLLEDFGKKDVWRRCEEMSVHGDWDRRDIRSLHARKLNMFFTYTARPAEEANRRGAQRYHMATPDRILPAPTGRLDRANAIRQAVRKTICISRTCKHQSHGSLQTNTTDQGAQNEEQGNSATEASNEARRESDITEVSAGAVVRGQVTLIDFDIVLVPTVAVFETREAAMSDSEWVEDKVRRWIEDEFARWGQDVVDEIQRRVRFVRSRQKENDDRCTICQA